MLSVFWFGSGIEQRSCNDRIVSLSPAGVTIGKEQRTCYERLFWLDSGI